MDEEVNTSCRKMDNQVLIDALLEDPTRSVKELSNSLNCTRQAVWRRKKALEDDNTIWGYTAVIDESKMNSIVYMVLMKMMPMSKEMAEILVRRVGGTEIKRAGIRLIDVFLVNGEYDIIVRFSSKDHAHARRHYDTLRTLYHEYLLEKPVMIDVNFIMMAEGKRNPHLSKLFDFVPTD